MDVETRLPLAMKLVSIQEYEGRWLVPLLEQAQHNLGPHAHIGTIVVDRGYLDGEDLWQLHHLGVRLVILGKANIAVGFLSPTVAPGVPANAPVRRGRPVYHESNP